MSLRIHLIHPSLEKGGSYKGCEGPRIAPTSLTTLARSFPPEVEVLFSDERVENIDYDIQADLVGLTLCSRTASRAYHIAAKFRAREVPVVLGGLHPAAMPGEAIQHCDAVVIGDAEGVLGQLTKDLRAGKLRKFYRSQSPPSLRHLPPARTDLLNGKRYLTKNVINATRGCPFGCEYCFTPAFNEGGFRMRPVKEVIGEIERMRGKELIFIDDNIIGNRRYAKELFTALIPLKKFWFSQCVIHLAKDDELVRLAAESGCKCILVGLETLDGDVLQRIGKPHYRPSLYEQAIQKLHDHGIMVLGSFIAGFDHDDVTIFERILEFTVKTKIDFMQCNPLAFYPGTAMFKRAIAGNRLTPPDWWLHDFPHVYKTFYEPKLMSAQELENGVVWLMTEFYKSWEIGRRLAHTPFNRLWFSWLGNMGLKDIGTSTPIPGFNPAEVSRAR